MASFDYFSHISAAIILMSIKNMIIALILTAFLIQETKLKFVSVLLCVCVNKTVIIIVLALASVYFKRYNNLMCSGYAC